MILILYILCCILAAWYTQKPWILLYSVVPLAFLIYCSYSGQESCKTIDHVERKPCDEALERQIIEWKTLGGPYYLHSDVHLVHLLYGITPCSLRSRLVHLCNLMLRMVEETENGAEPSVEQRRQMKDWYVELVNDSPNGHSCEGIREMMYRHIASYLL